MLLVAVKNWKSNASLETKALRDELLSALIDSYSNSEIEVTPKGKPYIKNQKAGFSVSHSGKAILLAVNTECEKVPSINNARVFKLAGGNGFEIGADIEDLSKRMPERLTLLCNKRFSEQEKELVQKAEDKSLAILSVWTRKEAYLKFTGQGLAGISSADTEMLKNEFYFYTDRITLGNQEYVFSICCER